MAETHDDMAVLARLYDRILTRRTADPEQSYVARLTQKGRLKIAQKLGEEAVETALAAVAGKSGDVIDESADLIFHLLILWADAGIAPGEVYAKLREREGVSGLAEKAARKKL